MIMACCMCVQYILLTVLLSLVIIIPPFLICSSSSEIFLFLCSISCFISAFILLLTSSDFLRSSVTICNTNNSFCIMSRYKVHKMFHNVNIANVLYYYSAQPQNNTLAWVGIIGAQNNYNYTFYNFFFKM